MHGQSVWLDSGIYASQGRELNQGDLMTRLFKVSFLSFVTALVSSNILASGSKSPLAEFTPGGS